MSRSSAERSRLESKRVQAHSSDVKISGTLNTGSQKLNGTYIREGRKEGRKEVATTIRTNCESATSFFIREKS